jgi:ankyrin repeat protein
MKTVETVAAATSAENESARFSIVSYFEMRRGPGARWSQRDMAAKAGPSEEFERQLAFLGALIRGDVAGAAKLLGEGVSPHMYFQHRAAAMHVAASPEAVRMLVERCGMDLYATDERGRTSVHSACARGDTPVLRELLRLGARADCVTKNGATPLHVAAARGHLGCVMEILSADSRPHIDSRTTGNAEEDMSASFRVDLFDPCIERALQVEMKRLSERGTHHLHAICWSKSAANIFPLVRPWLRKNLHLIDVKSERNWTPMHIAIVRGNSEVAISLLQMGADPNTRSVSDSLPAIVTAASIGDAKVVRALLQAGADPNLTSPTISSALFHSCISGSMDICTALLRAGARPSGAVGTCLPPLHAACVKRHSRIVQELIDHGADIHELNALGYSPIFTSIASGCVLCMASLCSAGADIDAPCRGWTPLRFALYLSRAKCADMLRDLGARSGPTPSTSSPPDSHRVATIDPPPLP